MLAEQLAADGVHVVLDQWDLKEGQDKHSFMEQAVTDPTIRRVLVLCDPTYAAKADGRAGGVGTETLIISPEVYREAKQEKFIPLVMERDEAGEVVLPTYLAGRIYIDLSHKDREGPEYEKLVRNIFGKPELVRPALGRPPVYVDESRTVLITGRSLNAFRDAVLRARPHQTGLLDDFLDKVLEACREELIEAPATIEGLDEAINASINRFVPYRDEFLELLHFIGKSDDAPRFYDHLHHFFEELATIRHSHKPTKWGEERETENLTFLGWELFLYAVAAGLRFGRFEVINALLEPYLVRDWKQSDAQLQSFSLVKGSMRTLQDVTQERLGTNYYSYAAYLLRERTTHRALPFEALMEADLVLWLRAAIDDQVSHWYPDTAVYAEMMPTLGLFSRANSASFFQRMAPALGVPDRSTLLSRFAAIPDGLFFKAGQFWGRREGYAELFQLDRLGNK